MPVRRKRSKWRRGPHTDKAAFLARVKFTIDQAVDTYEDDPETFRYYLPDRLADLNWYKIPDRDVSFHAVAYARCLIAIGKNPESALHAALDVRGSGGFRGRHPERA